MLWVWYVLVCGAMGVGFVQLFIIHCSNVRCIGRHLKRLDAQEILCALSVSKSDETDATNGGLAKV